MEELGKDIKDFEVIEPIDENTPGVKTMKMTQEDIDRLNQSMLDWEEERHRQEREAAEKAKEDYIRTIIDPDNPRELTDVLRKIAEELYFLHQNKAERPVYLR